MRARLVLLILSLLTLVGCDHATKLWAETSLRAAPPIEVVPGMLDLSYAQNPGVAFSLLGWMSPTIRTPLVLVAGLVAVLALVALLMLRRRQAKGVELAAYALLLGGALGNLIDRVARGYVVDFIHLHHWPVFNVADALIVVGLLLLLFVQQPPTRAAPRRSYAGSARWSRD